MARAASSKFGITSMLPGVADCRLTDENPARLGCAHVWSRFFLARWGFNPSWAGVPAQTGRTHRELRCFSYTVWRGRFGGDASVVGKMIPLEGKSVQVVGVLPADFEMPTLAEVDILFAAGAG